ncbi:hypothetical protein BDV24DRAFT_145304 [Aspergillus arachidicola]|uniref:Uncharacterized protein n=1 Tax=Aspergillus arachidicola TaxID=656916 RepID=A0A5N6XP60_9EURO|nr:hypothetical protein BDV24DRAFT_145304 [Aspergillus arachidicola]
MPVLVSHSLIVSSQEPEAIVCPSGEKATDRTGLEWPLNVCSSMPVLVSHSLIVLSSEPEAIVCPSGEKATDSTLSEWPSSVCSPGLHKSSICGNICICFGMLSENIFLIVLCIGKNTSPEQ